MGTLTNKQKHKPLRNMIKLLDIRQSAEIFTKILEEKAPQIHTMEEFNEQAKAAIVYKKVKTQSTRFWNNELHALKCERTRRRRYYQLAKKAKQQQKAFRELNKYLSANKEFHKHSGKLKQNSCQTLYRKQYQKTRPIVPYGN